jgi:hypothetical protein
MGAGKHVL